MTGVDKLISYHVQIFRIYQEWDRTEQKHKGNRGPWVEEVAHPFPSDANIKVEFYKEWHNQFFTVLVESQRANTLSQFLFIFS